MQWLDVFHAKNLGSEKRILLLEKDADTPERTWCFWSAKEHHFDHLVSHRWSKVKFASQLGEVIQTIDPFTYQYVSGRSFFDYAYKKVNADDRIDRVTAEVKETSRNDNLTTVVTSSGTYAAPEVYSSVPNPEKLHKYKKKQNLPGLYQHFRGWFIDTEEDVFDPELITLMDFRTEQKGGAVFFYTLPFSTKKALVECTVFGAEPWDEADYEERLREYTERYISSDITISHREAGQIPMSMINFDAFRFDGTKSLGTAAGLVKPSTGYMFLRSLRNVERLTDETKEPEKPRRFAFYDRLLLGIIRDEPQQISRIMYHLFSRNAFTHVFRFLDEETTLKEDVKMLSTLPYAPFLKQLTKQSFSRKRVV